MGIWKKKKSKELVMIEEINESLLALSATINNTARTQASIAAKVENHSLNFIFYTRAHGVAYKIISKHPDLMEEYFRGIGEENHLKDIQHTLLYIHKEPKA
jgi:hypothetical protein